MVKVSHKNSPTDIDWSQRVRESNMTDGGRVCGAMCCSPYTPSLDRTATHTHRAQTCPFKSRTSPSFTGEGAQTICAREKEVDVGRKKRRMRMLARDKRDEGKKTLNKIYNNYYYK